MQNHWNLIEENKQCVNSYLSGEKWFIIEDGVKLYIHPYNNGQIVYEKTILITYKEYMKDDLDLDMQKLKHFLVINRYVGYMYKSMVDKYKHACGM